MTDVRITRGAALGNANNSTLVNFAQAGRRSVTSHAFKKIPLLQKRYILIDIVRFVVNLECKKILVS